MAEWPDLDEFKQRLDITSDDWDGDADDSRLTRVLASAIEQTKQRVGDWDEAYDTPNERIAQSALELAVELATTGVTPRIESKSLTMLYGQRRRFSIG
jgi:hypothetical protein